MDAVEGAVTTSGEFCKRQMLWEIACPTSHMIKMKIEIPGRTQQQKGITRRDCKSMVYSKTMEPLE